MKVIMSLCLVLLLGSQVFLHASSFDPHDFVIVAYELTPEEENSFSITDHKASAFWDSWEGAGANKLDYSHLIPSVHGRRVCLPDVCPRGGTLDPCTGPNGFEAGNDDAQIWVRAAWGQKGLYLLVIAQDDEFVGLTGKVAPDPADPDKIYEGNEHWMNDCFDFELDIYNSEEQKQHFTCRPSQETMTYRQYQLRFGGGAEPPTVMRISDPKVNWNPGPECTNWLLNYNQRSLAEIQSQYNLKFEIFSLGENKKVQEWLIPWNQVGSAGMSKPQLGQRIAIAFVYFDMDEAAKSLDIVMPDGLFFREFGNSFVFRDVARSSGCMTGQNWGDIEMGAKINEAMGITSIIHLKNTGYKPPLNHTRSEFFTITGRRVYNHLNLAKTVMLSKTIGPNNILLGHKKIITVK